MNVTKASLALFDAEPEEKEEDGNESGINVVYLDKDMTFEMKVYVQRQRSWITFYQM